MILATLIVSSLSLMILLCFTWTALRVIGKLKGALQQAVMMQRMQQSNGQVKSPPIPAPAE